MLRMTETMMELKGKGVSPGYASGPAFILRSRHDGVAPSYKIKDGDVENEIKRLQSAVDLAIQDLKRIREFLERSLGESDARIFDYHMAVLNDRKFVGKMKNRIRDNLDNAESATDSVVEEIVGMFVKLDNRFLMERTTDIQDIGSRIRRLLNGNSKKSYLLPKGAILVADEIFPSDTVDFDHKHLKGIISERGGETSHAAILARALGIPMVIALDNATQVIESGMQLLVDGEIGNVIVLPSVAQQDAFTILGKQYEKEISTAEAEEVKACVTSDGTEISLWANIDFPSEAKNVLRHNLKGVGLLRSEYLFMKTDTAPSIDVHESEYKGIATNLQGAIPLTIRTLDLGGGQASDFSTKAQAGKSRYGHARASFLPS